MKSKFFAVLSPKLAPKMHFLLDSGVFFGFKYVLDVVLSPNLAENGKN